MKKDQFSDLMTLLRRLDKAKIPFTIEHSRDNALMIISNPPGEHWEVEFLEGEGIEIERFRSNGKICDESVLDELFDLWSDDESVAQEPAQPHDAISRN